MGQGINWAAGFRIQPKKSAIYAVVATVWPLSISGDGRQVLRADGNPFYFVGDAGNSISVQSSQADIVTYLADRADKGVTVVWLSMIEHRFSDNTPEWRNSHGDLPFSATLGSSTPLSPDFTTPVEAYWANIDWIINKAAEYGITFLATPAYCGFGQGVEGWAQAIFDNGTTNMTTYGTFIGNRYKGFPNIIWVMGGDSAPSGTVGNLTTHYNNLAAAIKAAGSSHLFTAHPGPGHSAFTDYNQTWLDINASYNNGNATDTHKNTRLARQETVKPAFFFEGTYGNEGSSTDLDQRTEMYQGFLAAGVGAVHGQDPQWYFGTNSGVSCHSSGFPTVTGLDWHNTLSLQGSQYLPFLKRLMVARSAISTLTPDYAHSVVTAGYDTGGVEGATYCPVMASNRMLVAYNRQGSGTGLTVNKATFVSATFNANWYNPRDGTTTSAGTVAMGSGTQVFTAPDANDWVLLLDDQALALSNP